MPIRTVLERGPKAKRVVAFALDWPGWSRGAKTAEDALATLEAYRDRYRPVAQRAGLAEEFDAAGPLEVVEDRVGTGSTDFWGISFSPCSLEQDPMDATELERKLLLLRAAGRLRRRRRAGLAGDAEGPARRWTRPRHDHPPHDPRPRARTSRRRSACGSRRTRRASHPAPCEPYRRDYVEAMRAYQRGEVANPCARGRWRSSSATPPSTRWTTRGRWRTRTSTAGQTPTKDLDAAAG